MRTSDISACPAAISVKEFGALPGSTGKRRRLLALSLAVVMAFFCSCESRAQINSDLKDKYIESQFDWAMYLERQDVKHYLNYEGSLLKPLTRIRIYFRAFPHTDQQPPVKNPARVYEEFWYQKNTLLGLRRRNKLGIEKNGVGIIIIGKGIAKSEQAAAVSNALVRLVLDLQFQQILTSVVKVPLDNFDQVGGGLANYRFSRGTEPEEGKQMSIHLRSEPEGKDEYYYLH